MNPCQERLSPSFPRKRESRPAFEAALPVGKPALVSRFRGNDGKRRRLGSTARNGIERRHLPSPCRGLAPGLGRWGSTGGGTARGRWTFLLNPSLAGGPACPPASSSSPEPPSSP